MNFDLERENMSSENDLKNIENVNLNNLQHNSITEQRQDYGTNEKSNHLSTLSTQLSKHDFEVLNDRLSRRLTREIDIHSVVSKHKSGTVENNIEEEEIKSNEKISDVGTDQKNSGGFMNRRKIEFHSETGWTRDAEKFLYLLGKKFQTYSIMCFYACKIYGIMDFWMSLIIMLGMGIVTSEQPFSIINYTLPTWTKVAIAIVSGFILCVKALQTKFRFGQKKQIFSNAHNSFKMLDQEINGQIQIVPYNRKDFITFHSTIMESYKKLLSEMTDMPLMIKLLVSVYAEWDKSRKSRQISKQIKKNGEHSYNPYMASFDESHDFERFNNTISQMIKERNGNKSIFHKLCCSFSLCSKKDNKIREQKLEEEIKHEIDKFKTIVLQNKINNHPLENKIDDPVGQLYDVDVKRKLDIMYYTKRNNV